jgi:MFS family permease
MSIGWPLAGSFSGRLALRYGYRTVALWGMALCALGALLLLTLGVDSSFLSVSAFAFLVGLGLGFSATPVLVSLQSAVSWAQRGVATGSQMFMRNFGSVVGLAISGALINHALAGRATSDTVSRILNVHGHQSLGIVARHSIQRALLDGIHASFVVALIASLAGFVALLRFPQQVAQPQQGGQSRQGVQPRQGAQGRDVVAAPQT